MIYRMTGKNRPHLIKIINDLDPEKLWRIEIKSQDVRTLEQNSKMHAMLGDIARQAKHLNMVLDVESWKRLCVDKFRKDCLKLGEGDLFNYWLRNAIQIMPNLDGDGVLVMGNQTKELPIYVVSGFIEWMLHYGTDCDPPIRWSAPKSMQEFYN